MRIENAYFLPDELVRKELITAAKRGTKIEIIVPGKYIDQKLVRAASKRHWPTLLKAGIKDLRVSTDHGARKIDDRGRRFCFIRLGQFR